MSLEKMHPTIKDQFCEQLYDDYLVNSSKILLNYEEYADVIHAKMPVSCYTNFRDALFHFRKVVYSLEESEIRQQAFAVKEHLSRSLTDAGSSILYHLSIVAEELLKDAGLPQEAKDEIRKSLHVIKKANLRKRLGGMMISDDNKPNIGHDEMQALMDEFYRLLEDKCPEEFAKYSHMLCDC